MQKCFPSWVHVTTVIWRHQLQVKHSTAAASDSTKTNPRLIGGSGRKGRSFGLGKAGVVPLIVVQSSLEKQWDGKTSNKQPDGKRATAQGLTKYHSKLLSVWTSPCFSHSRQTTRQRVHWPAGLFWRSWTKPFYGHAGHCIQNSAEPHRMCLRQNLEMKKQREKSKQREVKTEMIISYIQWSGHSWGGS